jgi:hypothetical protein
MDTYSIMSHQDTSESTQPDDAGQATVRPQPLPVTVPRRT